MRSPVLFLTALLLAAPSAAHAAEGDIIVQREPGTNASEIRRDADVELVRTLPIARTELVAPAEGHAAAALAELRADDSVASAELDRRVTAQQPVDDVYFPSLWGLSSILVADVWSLTQGSGVQVAVVDTGVAAAHADLHGQLVGNPGEVSGGRESNGVDDDRNGFVDDFRGWDFVTRDNLPQDGDGHGTHVSGTIAAVGNNSIGVVGVAPRSKVLPLRALDDDGSGWMSDIAAAFAYAGKLGVPIVNASLGGGYSATMANAIAAHPNTLYVVAAGNSNADNDVASTASYPCALPQPNIVCVGATDSFDNRASFSNYGATTVDLYAPGTSIRSTWISSTNSYASLSGTSMAAPHVAGTAALALSAAPLATTSQLKWALLSSVDVKEALTGTSVTGGRLNAKAAVAAIAGPLPAPEPTPTPTPEPPVPTATPTPPAVEPTEPTAPAPTAPVPPAPAPPAPASAPAAPAPVTPPAPRLSDVAVGGSLTGRHGKVRVSFRLTQAATVRFTVTAKGKRVASWTRASRGGANTVTLTRRLPTGKKLARGSYKLAVGLSATATTSTAIRVR